MTRSHWQVMILSFFLGFTTALLLFGSFIILPSTHPEPRTGTSCADHATPGEPR